MVPAAARISGVSCSQLVIGVPPKATMVSPGCSPARRAGVQVSWVQLVLACSATDAEAGTTHAETVEIVVFDCGMPMPIMMIAKMPTARMRFIAGPANMITIRLNGCSW